MVIDYAINQLESTNTPNAKSIQINLTGFLNAKVSFFRSSTFLDFLRSLLTHSPRQNGHSGAPFQPLSLLKVKHLTIHCAKLNKMAANNISQT